jgi:hypothetical protein
VKLDIYRSCSRQEKREVLETFWRTNVTATERVHQAAMQYGPYAVACLVAIALELAFVIAVSISRAHVVGGIAALFEVLAVVSLWWAFVRTRSVRSQPSSL